MLHRLKEIKEACKVTIYLKLNNFILYYNICLLFQSFEKVLVQNIKFGLSPPLTKALDGIPRWRLLQAALPHVMHCVSAMLHNRVRDMQAIGQVETKLLYTMQWIILYAAEECADDDGQDELMVDGESSKGKSMDQYLFSVPTVTVYLIYF